jgi:outer membrane protein assembly factor BamD (BamD/ComL family)
MEISMSVTGISNTSPTNSPSSPDSNFRTAMQQLTSAISSGDLKGAQSAYATLQQSSGKGGSTGPMAQFLSSIGADLSKGDLTTAQSTLSTFQKTHHHKPSADASSTADATSADATSAQTTSSNILDISA